MAVPNGSGAPPGSAGGFRTLTERTVFEGRRFSVRVVTACDPEGESFERDVVRHLGSVAVVPLHDDGTVSLVRQYRVAIGSAVLEAPAGTCDVPGEDPADTARRELAEEAGLTAKRVERIATVLSSPGYTDENTVVYLATGLAHCKSAPAGPEEQYLAVERVTLAEVESLVRSGRLLDATTIAGLLLARGAASVSEG